MADHISIVEVTAQCADEWLSLAPGGPDARARLLADMKARPRILRFVLKRGGSLLGRFAVEIGDVGATTWSPRLAQGVDPAENPFLLGGMVEHIAEICRQRSVGYAEYTSKSDSVEARRWETALLTHGFELTAVRYEWVRDGTWPSFDPPPGCRIIEVSTNHDQIAGLYIRSLTGSLDRTSVFEAAHGENLGGADRVFLAIAGDSYAGLCACLHVGESRSAWIKHVGVLPECRRKGIGEALVRFAGTTIAAAGAITTRSLIDTANEPSINLHKAAGFGRTGTFGHSYYLVL